MTVTSITALLGKPVIHRWHFPR